MLIVGLSGRKGAGKNTVADDICLRFLGCGLRVEFYAFADTLKSYCQKLFGLTAVQCYGTDAQKNTLSGVQWRDLPFLHPEALRTHPRFMTAREVFQIFGTNIVRRMNSDAWVDATLAEIEEERPDIALVTDVRFPNEVEGIQAHEGRVIRLTRAPYTEDTHFSETALDGYGLFDYVLPNAHWTHELQAERAIELVKSWL